MRSSQAAKDTFACRASPASRLCFIQRKKQTKQRHVTQGNPLKNLRFHVDLTQCSVNQKNRGYLHKQNPLSFERVAHSRLKEHFLVSKRLKSISKQRPTGPKRHEVTPIKSSTKQEAPQNPYLNEWGQVKEERHFHIGRVIKYLID